ncbi:aldehyde dehydrogenase EutE [Raoultella planticola]|uniref:Aldehyde dehydrogenase EutE n=1 Tax=Raoultella planticola TaxID=575 RepID=A0A485AQL0_RAOPL|nr:aldehyde dehydrogenase EutE [Raoultella planticola]
MYCVTLINQQLARLGAPASLVVTVASPSIDNTNALIGDARINMLVATGGPAIVENRDVVRQKSDWRRRRQSSRCG